MNEMSARILLGKMKCANESCHSHVHGTGWATGLGDVCRVTLTTYREAVGGP